MVKLFLVLFISTGISFAQEKVFEFESKIPELTEKFKALKVEEEIRFEDQFNTLVKELEQTLEKEKNICAGEMSMENGEIVSKENRQLCLRKIKQHYLVSFTQIHLLKKRYLTLIHKKQIDELDENFEKLKSQFDKNF